MRVMLEAIPDATFDAARVADQGWNGWLCPFFSIEEAQRLLTEWNKASDEHCRFVARYDSERDAFGFIEIEAGVDPDACPEQWNWFARCDDGTYAIGAWCWCWWPADETET